MKKYTLLFIVGILGLIVLSSFALAETVILQPDPYHGKDTWVSSANESGKGNYSYIISGRYWRHYHQEYWSFIEFDYSSFIDDLENATNVSAELQLRHYYGRGPNNHKIYQANGTWDEHNLTWQNKPEYGYYYDTQYSLPSYGWYGWDVTDQVTAVAAGEIDNNGFIIRRPDVTNYNMFYSSDYSGATYRPKLVITYET